VTIVLQRNKGKREKGVLDMNKKPKTVVFGPFIGEFGWETMHWMGFVNHLCSTRYQDYRKVVASYPGRSVLYPYADEFIPLPQWFLDLKPSARNYILDGWVHGFPGISSSDYGWNIKFILRKILKKEKPHRILKETPYSWPSMRDQAEGVLSEILSRYSFQEYTLICPWKVTSIDGREYGFNDLVPERYLSQEENIRRFPNPNYEWSRLISTEKGKKYLSELNQGDCELISIFPRRRLVRRQDKNWEYGSYLKLIDSLSVLYPNARIVLCGEPNGAYFQNSVPSNCIDLINMDPEIRLDAHIAALEHSVVAIGSLSGAMFLPLMTETPSVVFGFESEKARFERDNYLNTNLRYLVSTNPSVEEVLREVADLVAQ
jgi:hypothetical protein